MRTTSFALPRGISPKRFFLPFLRLGLVAFGGPAMVAYIKALAVSKEGWLSEDDFNEGVVLCQAIPGATALQMAAYVGLRASGPMAAVVSFLGFALPAFLLMLSLSALYVWGQELGGVVALFQGLKVIVVAIVLNATWGFGRRLLHNPRDFLLALLAAGLLLQGLSPFAVIGGAALAGIFLYRELAPGALPSAPHGGAASVARQALTIGLAVALVLAALYLLDGELFSLAVVMMKVDLFAFGGAFAALPLLLHEVVKVRGWLQPEVFMDGVALGQVTPGPVVITATFIGYMVRGLVGALVATVAVFTPSLSVLVLLAPVFARLRGSVLFHRATRGVLCSFVGLLLFVTLRFALSADWDVAKALLFAASAGALLRGAEIVYVVLLGAGVSVLLF